MISKKSVLASVWFACWSFSSMAAEKIKVVTTLPDLTWMVQEIGGDLVEAKPPLRKGSFSNDF